MGLWAMSLWCAKMLYMPMRIQWVGLVSDSVWGCGPCDYGMLIYYMQCADLDLGIILDAIVIHG